MIGVIAYGIVSQGLLAGAMRGGVVDSRLAGSFARVRGENLRKNLETVDALEGLHARAIGDRLGVVARR